MRLIVVLVAVVLVGCRASQLPSAPADAPDVPTTKDMHAAFERCRQSEERATPGGPFGNACMNAGSSLTLSPTIVGLVSRCRSTHEIDTCLELARRYRDGVGLPTDHARAYEFAAIGCEGWPPHSHQGACMSLGWSPPAQ